MKIIYKLTDDQTADILVGAKASQANTQTRKKS